MKSEFRILFRVRQNQDIDTKRQRKQVPRQIFKDLCEFCSFNFVNVNPVAGSISEGPKFL